MDTEETKIIKSIGDSFYGIVKIDLKYLKFGINSGDISQTNFI